MARRNLFNPPPPPDGSPAPQTEATESRPRFPNTGAMSGVKSTLKDLSSNAVRDIAPDSIDDSGPKDRLAFSDEDVRVLADSIRAHGQQVPIMVRPLPDRPGQYRIVYGRRRLRALKLLGQSAKALVRSLSDSEAILAQGQENSQRLDPSFIEKALFATELAEADYEASVIVDALATDKPMLSRMNKVARSIPAEVIQAIGPGHGIGRRRWEDLADLVRDHKLNLADMVQGMDLDGLASDDRFARIAAAAQASVRVKGTPSAASALSVTLKDGTRLAEVKETARAVTVKLSKTDTPEFARWLRENADAELKRLYEAWKSAT